jgi:hypothetical protein
LDDPDEARSAMSFQVHDTVRIVRLLVADREVTGSSPMPPQPRVGETGVVVADVGDGLLLVEHVTDDGHSVWMAEFSPTELEKVPEQPMLG